MDKPIDYIAMAITALLTGIGAYLFYFNVDKFITY